MQVDMKTFALIAVALVSCGKSAPKQEMAPKGSAAPPATGSAEAAAPTEAAEVVGPTKSASGKVELSGAITGSFEWSKKDQKTPITCIWDPDKELGTLRLDLSDGAGHLVTIGIDIPPTEAGPGRLDVSSKDLAKPLKTYAGFKLKGDDASAFSAVFDDAVAVTDADKQLADKGKKNADKPEGPTVTLKGTIDVTCPKKK
jgi:hypothetical protein